MGLEARLNGEKVQAAKDRWDSKTTTCSNCKFFKMLGATKGECRFNPPEAALIPSGPNQMSRACYWPYTEPGDWCGKYEADLTNKEIV